MVVICAESVMPDGLPFVFSVWCFVFKF